MGLQLTSESNNQDLTSEIDNLCDSDSNSYPLKDKVRRINYSLETLVAHILDADGTWEWDDTNYTDLPRGTATLVDGQESYAFSSEYLGIKWIKILTKDGIWQFLDPIDQAEIDVPFEEYFSDTGISRYYEKNGDTIRLYPAPDQNDVTLTDGLKVQFERTIDYFTVNDTTQEPGIASPFHVTVAYMAAIPYCMSYKPERVPLYQQKVDKDIEEMLKFYSRRERDTRNVASTAPPRGVRSRSFR